MMNILNLKRSCAFVLMLIAMFGGRLSAQQKHERAAVKIVNFDKDGKQIMRFSTLGDAIDAHDGEIAFFEGKYYLYGTSYDCGFEWGNKTAPFCGFKSYSSTDMVNWTDEGELFNAKTTVWQTRCDGSTYGCFRPHVIFNKKTGLYVLWINVYDNVSGYRVFTSPKPTGPFTEVAEPKLGINQDAPAKGLNNGDHDTFIDDDGTAYLAYTDWRTNGQLIIEQLSDDYLTGTGHLVKSVTSGNTEAPGLFKRNGIYYLTYSDPNCGYCGGTGTSYKTARSPLGPWSDEKKISDNSCGGQPSFVSTIKTAEGNVYLYGSDLWNNAAKNEALANYFWAPLSFNDDGSIKPIVCGEDHYVQAVFPKAPVKVQQLYYNFCDLTEGIEYAQPISIAKSGVIKSIKLNVYQTGRPDGDLVISICKAGKDGAPNGQQVYTQTIDVKRIGWSAKQVEVRPDMNVRKGESYFILIGSTNKKGNYGLIYGAKNGAGNLLMVSRDGGTSFNKEDKALKMGIVFK